jgi:hypothetical protein
LLLFSNCDSVFLTTFGPNSAGTSLVGTPLIKLLALWPQSPSFSHDEHPADANEARATMHARNAMQIRNNVEFFISSPLFAFDLTDECESSIFPDQFVFYLYDLDALAFLDLALGECKNKWKRICQA